MILFTPKLPKKVFGWVDLVDVEQHHAQIEGFTG
jgi:hypothetical protein